MSHLSLLVTTGRARPKPHVAVGIGGEPVTVWDARQVKSLTSASATQRRSTPQTFWFAGTSIVRPSMTTRTLLQPTKPPLARARPLRRRRLKPVVKARSLPRSPREFGRDLFRRLVLERNGQERVAIGASPGYRSAADVVRLGLEDDLVQAVVGNRVGMGRRDAGVDSCGVIGDVVADRAVSLRRELPGL